MVEVKSRPQTEMATKVVVGKKILWAEKSVWVRLPPTLQCTFNMRFLVLVVQGLRNKWACSSDCQNVYMGSIPIMSTSKRHESIVGTSECGVRPSLRINSQLARVVQYIVCVLLIGVVAKVVYSHQYHKLFGWRSVMASTPPCHGGGQGSNPSSAAKLVKKVVKYLVI